MHAHNFARVHNKRKKLFLIGSMSGNLSNFLLKQNCTGEVSF